jgi:hypothetical protein
VSKKLGNSDVLLVVGAVTGIFILNFAWMEWIQHSHPDQLQAIANNPQVTEWKKLLDQPMSLVALLVVVTFWIVGFIRSRRRSTNRLLGMVILALALSTVLGFVIFTIFVR